MKIKNYYHYLPRDYFHNLYAKVADKLLKSENTCISVMYGCGGKTFLNLFLRLAEEDSLFKNIHYFDPEIEKEDIIEYTKNKLKRNNTRKLIVVRHFEKIEKKRETLEILNRLRQPHPENLIYLVITDHTGVTQPEKYMAKTNIFFPDRFYISPFNLNQTTLMISITAKFFAWEIDERLYQKLYKLSGGIPRLIKHIYKEIIENKTKIDSLDKFLKNAAILFQLRYLTELLVTLDNDHLKTLGLINKENKIKSQLLGYYFNSYQSEMVAQLFPNLSFLEAKVFSYLYENKGEIVSIDKIGDLVEMSGSDFSLWAIYKLISRLKPKVKKYFNIGNIKGRGYVLQNINDKIIKK